MYVLYFIFCRHGNGKVFSCRGIEICVNYFLQRGHKVTVFVPQWRKYRPSFSNPIVDQAVLDKLRSNGNLVFTPSRRIHGKTISSYDDRCVYILKLDNVISQSVYPIRLPCIRQLFKFQFQNTRLGKPISVYTYV